jgi:fructose-bisphosphate aldolase class II
MKTLREYIVEAGEKGVAIGHFNISNMEAFHGVYNAAKRLNVPVIIGLSEGEEDFFGRNEAVSLIKGIREKDNFPIFLNADHHYSFERVKLAIDSGFDSVIVDAVTLPLGENIALVKKCVEYAKSVGEKEGRDILVEAELGFIGQSSKMLDSVPDGVSDDTMTTPEDAKAFVDATGVDMLAPSVGNVHGMVKSGNPRLHPDVVKSVREASGVPLVLHGGSGVLGDDFISCIKNGVSVVHINTEIRVAYRSALEQSLKDNPNEIAPYKYLSKAVSAIEEVVFEKLKIFNNIS